MKKITLSLIALMALTGAAIAREKSEIDDHILNGRVVSENSAAVDSAPSAIIADDENVDVDVDSTNGFSTVGRTGFNAFEDDSDNGENDNSGNSRN